MVKYNILISFSAEKSLRKIPKNQRNKIIRLIQTLAFNPLPQGVRKLIGERHTYRVRQGNYRVIYELKNRQIIVLVLKIGHRKNISR